MSEQVVEKYQMAGIDERDRGFNRPVGIQNDGKVYRATLQYERTFMMGESFETTGAALLELVRRLQHCGYRQLRSQLSFRGAQYLGNQEPWVEYADPETAEARQGGSAGVWASVLRLFGRSA